MVRSFMRFFRAGNKPVLKVGKTKGNILGLLQAFFDALEDPCDALKTLVHAFVMRF